MLELGSFPVVRAVVCERLQLVPLGLEVTHPYNIMH